MSCALRQRDILFKVADTRLGANFLRYLQCRIIIFVPGFTSFVELKYMCDVFGGLSTFSRLGIFGPCPSFLPDYTSGELLVFQSCRPFVLEVGILSKGRVKGGSF